MLTKYIDNTRQIQEIGPKFVEKIFTSEDGRKFRVVFLVSIFNGELKGQIVSVQLLSKDASNIAKLNGDCSHVASSIPCLPIITPSNISKKEFKPAFTPFVSPYSELLFFTSQPTRAPNFS